MTIKNSQRAIDLAKRIKNLNTLIEEKSTTIHKYSNDKESAENYKNADAVSTFDKIENAYKDTFNNFGQNDQERINAIFKEIKSMLLNEIINTPKIAPDLQEWIEKNKSILLDEKHADYNKVLTESRKKLNDTKSIAQTAWRNFDPGAKIIRSIQDGDYYQNLFVGNINTVFPDNKPRSPNAEVRKKLAYYYLAITDYTRLNTLQLRDKIKANFIGRLADIRRGHNEDNTSIDMNCCIRGYTGSLLKMGNYHPIADCSMSFEEKLHKKVQSFVANKLNTPKFALPKNDPKKQQYFSSLEITQSMYLNEIINNEEDFSDDLLNSRLEILSHLEIDISTDDFPVTGTTFMELLDLKEQATLSKDELDYFKAKINLMLLNPLEHCSDIINEKFSSAADIVTTAPPAAIVFTKQKLEQSETKELKKETKSLDEQLQAIRAAAAQRFRQKQ